MGNKIVENYYEYQDISTIKKLKNAEVKLQLTKNILEYSKQIISELQNNPSLLDEILFALEISEKDFFEYLSGDKQANISFYDETLSLIYLNTNRRSR